jgi:hypothetical protein
VTVRVDLPSGAWAELRGSVREADRRAVRSAALAATDDADLDAVVALLVATLVADWSYDRPMTPDAVRTLPTDAREVLAMACAPTFQQWMDSVVEMVRG